MKNIYVFDMGRVILKGASLDKMYQEANCLCSYETFKNIFYNSYEAMQVYRGLIDDDTYFLFVKEASGSKKTVSQLKELYLKNKTGVYKDTIEIIEKLKNDNMICLLSNIKVIDHLYLKSVVDMNLFDKTFLSYEMHAAKPDDEIYKSVIKELGTNDFYFFDDSKKNVESAILHGIDAYQVTGDNIKECFTKILKK